MEKVKEQEVIDGEGNKETKDKKSNKEYDKVSGQKLG